MKTFKTIKPRNRESRVSFLNGKQKVKNFEKKYLFKLFEQRFFIVQSKMIIARSTIYSFTTSPNSIDFPQSIFYLNIP